MQCSAFAILGRKQFNLLFYGEDSTKTRWVGRQNIVFSFQILWLTFWKEIMFLSVKTEEKSVIIQYSLYCTKNEVFH